MTDQQTANELERLLEEARGGAPNAMERLLVAVRPRILRWALVKTGDPDAAEDVAQEVALRVTTRLNRFHGRSRFTSWLYALTRNAALDHHRRRARRGEVQAAAAREEPTHGHAVSGPGGTTTPPGTTPDTGFSAESLDRQRLMDLVLTFFRELPERQREVFDLSELQGMGSPEIAEMLGIEPVSVRANLFKARRTIRRRILESHGELVEDR